MRDFVEPIDVAQGLAAYQRLSAEGLGEELFADFMVFCWQAVDPGRVAALDLDDDLVDACADQLSVLLHLVDHQCHKWGAPVFWKRYIEWADLAVQLSVEECKEFMIQSPGYREPAFFVFLATNGEEMRLETMLLLSHCSQSTSMRSSYVRSVIESRLRAEALPRM